MDYVVLLKQVPDLAEELEIDDSGVDLAREWMSFVTSEWDEYALEEALQLKESGGGTVTCLALGVEAGDVDEMLATCLARGADRVVKVGSFKRQPDSHTAAAAYAVALDGIAHDLVLTGVQAVDDLDGQVGPLLATRRRLPHVSVVTHIAVGDGDGGRTVTVHQEYAGGVVGEFEVDLPAVLGVQTSREAPRYAPVSRVRQLMKTATIETVDAGADGEAGGGLVVEAMSVPESGGSAEMIAGSPAAIADRIAAILAERGFGAGVGR
jgi:electron transfer flavoprotein beta subunit